MSATITHYFHRVFSVDLRALALFRIGIALVLLFDLGFRWTDLAFFYTDSGIFPRETLSLDDTANYPSLFFLSGSSEFATLLFILAAISYFMLLIGWRTSFFTVLSWFFLVSLINRNLGMNNAGDGLLRLMLLWGAFLPLGKRYSVDANRSKEKNSKNSFFSPATVVILLQVSVLYFFAGITKDNNTWLISKTALFQSLYTAYESSDHAQWLLNFPSLLKWMSPVVKFGEILVAFLLLVPAKNFLFRTLSCYCILIFQLLIALFLKVGLFPWISIVAIIPFLPFSFFNRFEKSDVLKQENTSNEMGVRAKKWKFSSFLIVFLFSFHALSQLDEMGVPKKILAPITSSAQFYQVHQHWSVYQNPNTHGRDFIVMLGTTKEGKRINLLDPQQPPSSEFVGPKNFRHRILYMLSLKPHFGKAYGRYFCRQYRLEGLSQVEIFKIKGQQGSEPQKVLSHACGG